MPLRGRGSLTQAGTHKIQSKCGYPCLNPNVLLPVAVCSAQDALVGIVSIYEFPTPYSSMARKCVYSEYFIQSRTYGYTELSEVRSSYPECPISNIGTIQIPASYKNLIRLENLETVA